MWPGTRVPAREWVRPLNHPGVHRLGDKLISKQYGSDRLHTCPGDAPLHLKQWKNRINPERLATLDTRGTGL